MKPTERVEASIKTLQQERINGCCDESTAFSIATELERVAAELKSEKVASYYEAYANECSKNADLKRQVAELANWKREMLLVKQWWQDADDYIRANYDVTELGKQVSKIVLARLKERDQLRAQLASLKRCSHVCTDGNCPHDRHYREVLNLQ